MKKSNLTDKELAKILKKIGNSFKLSASDKGILKAELMDVVKNGSLQISERSKIKNIINPRRLAMPLIPMIIAVIIALGGGTAALANTANPGDFLYPVDQWVEGVQGRFMRSDEAKAVWQARLGEERLAEFRALHSIDPSDWSEEDKALLEQHRQEATERLENRLQGIRNAQEQLEIKLESATDDATYQGVEKALGRLEEIEARQETRIAEIEDGINFPQLSPETKRRFQEARQEHQRMMQATREQIMKHLREALDSSDSSETERFEKPEPLFPPLIQVPDDLMDSNNTGDAGESNDGSNGGNSGEKQQNNRFGFDDIIDSIL